MIYLDNAATTKMDASVYEKMLPYFQKQYGNPSAIYQFAAESKNAITDARDEIASFLQVKPETIYFTSGGSESDNWALTKVAEANIKKGKHVITSCIEHHAILHTAGFLEKMGFEVTYLPVDENGAVRPEEVAAAIRPDTILISIMAANNEIGTIQPLQEIGELAHENGILFHTDAVQAFGQIPLDIEKMHIDLLSASAHKLYGPKGVGLLYIREGVMLPALIHGGAQERNRRAGTENVPGIVGFGEAVRIAKKTMDERMKQETVLRDYLIHRIEQEIADVHLNGSRTKRLPNNVNFSFRHIEGESLLIMLDMQDIFASSGSACTAGSIDPSHVLLALHLSGDEARESLRLTLSKDTTKEEIDLAVEAIKTIVRELRSMSPYQK